MEQLIIAVLGSSLLTTILTRIFTVRDRKKDKTDEILSSLKDLKRELFEHKRDDERHKANMSRTRIIHFSDELRRGVMHSQESFNNVLEDKDEYLKYCARHNEYVNGKADAAIRNIVEVYDKCIRGELDFL